MTAGDLMNLDHLEPRVWEQLNRQANSGGPMSRTRKERVRSTLLGNDAGAIRCPRIVRVGITFHGEDPVEALTEVLQDEGFGSPEDLREAFEIPGHALVARRPESPVAVVDTRDGTRCDLLWNALVLGLCTAQLYDPLRPALWTQASLTRQLELFDSAGFYA